MSVLRRRYFTEPKSLKRQDFFFFFFFFFFFMSEVTDIPLLMRKYCIIKKGKSQTGHCADFIQAFLVLSVCNTRDTDL